MKLLMTWVLLIGTVIFSGQASAERLRIAVAANFAPVLTQIAQLFEQETNQHIDIIQGSTGKFYAQIIRGAPFDIFFAADAKRPQLLERDQLIVSNSRMTYAIGQLVLWTASQQDVFERLKSGNFTKLAIANPKLAPYGQAAIEVLRTLNLYDQVNSKLVMGENVAQAFQFVHSGGAEMGFVPFAFVKKAQGNYWLPPVSSYHPIEQQLVILRSTGHLALAQRFIEYLSSDKMKTLISNSGYVTP